MKKKDQYRLGYEAGLRSAADFANEWNNQIFGTPYNFGDIILCKHNMLAKKKIRKKKCSTAKSQVKNVKVGFYCSPFSSIPYYIIDGRNCMYGVPLDAFGFKLLAGSQFRVVVMPLPSPGVKKTLRATIAVKSKKRH